MKCAIVLTCLSSLVLAENLTGTEVRHLTSEQMLQEVTDAWRRPAAENKERVPIEEPDATAPLLDKLDRIVLPAVNFNGMELSRVVNTLSLVSQEHDLPSANPRGLNIVLIDPAGANPVIHLNLRNLSLRRVLDFVTRAAGYQYEVQPDAVVVRPGGQADLATRFFPVSRPTVLRLSGRASTQGARTPK